MLTGALFSHTVFAAYGDVTSFTSKVYAGDGGQAANAWLDFPEDINFDADGNLYVADTENFVIRKIDTNGVISTYAGSGHYGFYNAPGNAAQFASPKGLAIDSSGNIYVADTDNNMIRKIDRYRGISTVLSDNLNAPEGITVYGSYLYIADTGNNAVKKLNLGNGRVDILSSDVSHPRKLVVNTDGSLVYVTDSGNNRVVSVNTSTGLTSLIAGSSEGYREGVGSAAKFSNLAGIAFDGTYIYVGDGSGHDNRIRKIHIGTRQTSLVADDPRLQVFSTPFGIRIRNGKIYGASTGNSTIQSFTASNGEHYARIAGIDRFGYRNGSITEALFGRPNDVVMNAARTKMYVAENNKIREINLETSQVRLVAGNSIDDYVGEGQSGSAARFSTITAMAINSDGDTLYVVDHWNNRIRAVDVATGTTSLIAGGGEYNTSGSGNGYAEGSGESARFDNPFGIAISPDDTTLYITDVANRRIRKVVISTGATSLVAGSGANTSSDGSGAAASFMYPAGITIDTAGENLYVADRDAHTLRKIRLSDAMVTTIVGTAGRQGYRDGIGANAVLSYPLYVKWGSDNRLYFSEAGSLRLRLVEVSDMLTKLVAGSGNRGYHDSTRTDAKFNNIAGFAVDIPSHTLFAADNRNDLIRRISIAGSPPYSDPQPVVQGVRPSPIKDQTDASAVAYLDVLGANFLHGAETKFGDFRTTTYVKSDSQLTVVIPIGLMEPGHYDVSVTNLDGQVDILTNGFGLSDANGNVPERFFPILEQGGFYAYAPNFPGGVNLSSGDVNNDGRDEIITAPASLGGPHVRYFTKDGSVVGQLFAYAPSYRGGVSVASCDIDGDGKDDIVTGTDGAKAPHVRILRADGSLINQFFAYPQAFRIGVTVACGDVTGDGNPEIVVSPQARGGPHVRVFTPNGQLVSQFFAYPAHFRLGLDLALGDTDGDGTKEIIVAPLTNGGPHVRRFNAQGQLLGQFFAYGANLRTGITIEAGDTDGDGRDEIVTGTENGAAPHIRIFDGNGSVEGQFYGFASRLRNGVHIGVGDYDGDGVADIAASLARGLSTVHVYDSNGNDL